MSDECHKCREMIAFLRSSESRIESEREQFEKDVGDNKALKELVLNAVDLGLNTVKAAIKRLEDE